MRRARFQNGKLLEEISAKAILLSLTYQVTASLHLSCSCRKDSDKLFIFILTYAYVYASLKYLASGHVT